MEDDEVRQAQNWSHSTGMNAMCFLCPLLHSKCIGSKNKLWNSCQRRIATEREMEKWKITELPKGR